MHRTACDLQALGARSIGRWAGADLSSRSRSRWSRRSSGTVAVCRGGCSAAAADAAAPDCSAASAACASRCGRSTVAEKTTAAASVRRCRCCARSDGVLPEKNVLWRVPCCSCCNLQQGHSQVSQLTALRHRHIRAKVAFVVSTEPVRRSDAGESKPCPEAQTSAPTTATCSCGTA
jgi:hypothetical protein